MPVGQQERQRGGGGEGDREIHAGRQTETKTATDRETDRQTARQRQRETDRQTERNYNQNCQG